MHRTLKLETTRPARPNLLQQQELFDAFREVFNTKRPHEALDMRRPAELYGPSLRPCPTALPEPTYPLHDDTLYVSARGHLRVPGRGSLYLSVALAGHPVGILEQEDGRWLVSFLDLALGHVEKSRTFTPIQPASPGNRNL